MEKMCYNLLFSTRKAKTDVYRYVSREFMTTELLTFRCIRLWSITSNVSSDRSAITKADTWKKE